MPSISPFDFLPLSFLNSFIKPCNCLLDSWVENSPLPNASFPNPIFMPAWVRKPCPLIALNNDLATNPTSWSNILNGLPWLKILCAISSANISSAIDSGANFASRSSWLNLKPFVCLSRSPYRLVVARHLSFNLYMGIPLLFSIMGLLMS